MNKNSTILRLKLFSIAIPKMKELTLHFSYIILVFLLVFNSACKKDNISGGGTSGGSAGSASGVWQRYGSPNGYNTDLAVGNIPGEPSNRVYMCEHPGSPSAGLYKGYINGNIITWDASYNLPDAEFKEVGAERTLYFGVGAVSDAGKYKKGVWTNTCGELKNTPKNVYYKWTTGSTCSIPSTYTVTYKHADLPSSPSKNQLYGPIGAGSLEIVIKSSGSPTPTSNYFTLSAPAAGYKRTYTHNIIDFESSLGRCVFFLDLTYVDTPM